MNEDPTPEEREAYIHLAYSMSKLVIDKPFTVSVAMIAGILVHNALARAATVDEACAVYDAMMDALLDRRKQLPKYFSMYEAEERQDDE